MSGVRNAFTLIQYWHEQVPPDHVVETLDSFKKQNPDMEQLVFDEPSAEAFIAAHYGSAESAAFRACAVPAMQADYFRYCAVHALGGVYADANFRCLDSLKWIVDRPERGVLFGRQDPLPNSLAIAYSWPYAVGSFRAVTNGVFGFGSQGHPLLELAIQISTANIENRVADGAAGVWVTAGPGVFTSLYLLRELGSIDAFLEYSVGSVIESMAPSLCEVVGDHDRVASAWDGVCICPMKELKSRCEKSDDRLKSSHWLRIRGNIYE
jgi:hypothetical protein